ncbi:MAG: VWA domain-containing protein [Candidatus Hodarchaeales archaeon]|jgi:Mg-chelatase subunit ChlD
MSTRKVSTDKKILSELPLIGQIKFEDLEREAKIITSKMITCSLCGAILIDPSLVKTSDEIGLHYTCSYCGTLNKLSSNDKAIINQINTSDDIIEFVEPREEVTEIKPTVSIETSESDALVAIIDVSGSMSGAKIAGVKQSLEETVTDLGINKPGLDFTIITFTDRVKLINSQGNDIVNLSGDDLYSEEKIRKAFQTADYNFEAVGPNKDKFKRQISMIRAQKTTALGPAVLGAVELLSRRKEGGRTILLTDGLANLGVGRLQGYAIEGRGFYAKIGKECANKGIVIDTIGVTDPRSGSNMSLDIVHLLATLSGGDVSHIDLGEIASTFSSYRDHDIIGKQVTIDLFFPENALKINEITGMVNFTSDKNIPTRMRAKLGAVSPDRTMNLAFDVDPDKITDEITTQTQIEYTDLSGNKRVRVFKNKIVKAQNNEELKEAYDSSISDSFYIQKSSELSSKRKFEDSRDIMNRYQQNLQANMAFIDREKAEASKKSVKSELRDLEEFEVRDVDYSSTQAYSKMTVGVSSEMRKELRKMRVEKKKESRK